MPTYLDLKVVLLDIEAPVWRQFLLRGDASFLDLHQAIQTAAGWQGRHIHQFRAGRQGGAFCGRGHHEPGEDRQWADSSEVPVSSVLRAPGERCYYWYDPGDNWELSVDVVRTVGLDESFLRRLIDGRRAFPLEHIGGVAGYRNCLAALGRAGGGGQVAGGMDAARTESLLRWLAQNAWSPEECDLPRLRKAFDR